MEDKEILKRINQGWEPAFKELFGRYYTTLCAFASRIVKNEESAKDIVQEVFIKLWSNRGQLKDISLKSYLFVCVRNTSLTFLRDQKRKEDQLVQIPWEEEETASYLIEEENNRLLFEAIAKLPPRSAEVISLGLEGLKQDEIAKQMDISINTVKFLKYEAIRKLKELLKPLIFWFFLMKINSKS
ncbi:RNA polymerase sigma factor [Butyricimonas paravirosa]|uniref:RNA polymerase sigma factor n=1 Tax=Butyricimonas paravirosa TaxID=1472417 RepID=UPI00210BCA2A|nr:RNA polymerase sigma-70 factor [Butyricimonas paravirosa]MCQ4872707.1 RNA polymerase sigma-70 factor [Butyricimonas paravirosa]